jgi:carboxyl-terminal processing protease
MNRKLRYTLLAAAAVALVAISTAAYKADFKLGQNIELVVNMMRAVFTHYVDEVDADTLGKNAAAGMVAALDPYTELIHADDSESFEMMTTGKYGGIGSVIRQKGEWVQIAEPYQDSPSGEAGLEIGDTFLEIDGKSARGMTTTGVSGALRGEPGTKVTIRVKKFHTGREESHTLTRRVIARPAVAYHSMVADSVGYIRFTDFTEGSADEFHGALDALRREGARSLVVDLRSNGGGILQEAVKIVGMFTPSGTPVVEMRGRSAESNRKYATATEPVAPRMPVAVLVDGHSASASEIVAGAFQDLDRAVVVGRRTFGKGVVQSTMQLGYGSYVKITTAKYYIPSGRCVQAVDYSHGGEDDPAGPLGGQRAVPDSLLREFRTAGGRPVWDGSGVVPDVAVEAEYNSRFAVVVYARGYIDDFADEWSRRNRGSRDTAPATFALTDDDWAAFTAFMRDKELEYESATGLVLDRLKATAEAERYMTPEVKELMASLDGALRDDDTEANMALYRGELSRLVEDAIMLRFNHSRGVIAHRLPSDGELRAALGVLADGERYREILTPHDNEKR